MCCRQHKMTQHRRQHRNSSNFLSGQTWQGPGQESSPVHNYSPDTTLLLLLLPLVNILSLGNCWKRGKNKQKNFLNFSGLLLDWNYFYKYLQVVSFFLDLWKTEVKVMCFIGERRNKQVTELQRNLGSHLGLGISQNVGFTQVLRMRGG